MALTEAELVVATRELAQVTGSIATYLDRSEHLEPALQDVIADGARRLRVLAFTLAAALGVDLIRGYAARLEVVENRSPLGREVPMSPVKAALAARSLRDLQLAQLAHDRWFHPDVFGLSRTEQLRHFVLHLAKLTSFASALPGTVHQQEDFERSRVPDIFLFGLKLATAAGVQLPDTILNECGTEADSVVAD